MERPIHYGSIRWSSNQQEEGDYERSQRTSITNDAALLGVTIDQWLIDCGLSASTGRTSPKASFSRFSPTWPWAEYRRVLGCT